MENYDDESILVVACDDEQKLRDHVTNRLNCALHEAGWSKRAIKLELIVTNDLNHKISQVRISQFKQTNSALLQHMAKKGGDQS